MNAVIVSRTDAHDPTTTWLTVQSHGESIGYAEVADLGDQMWIVAIAVHPHHRHRGLGQTLLRAVVDAWPGRTVALCVEPFQPVHWPAEEGMAAPELLSWFARHGFICEPDGFGDIRMARSADSTR